MARTEINYNNIDQTISKLDEQIKKLKLLLDEQNKNFTQLDNVDEWIDKNKEIVLSQYNEVKQNYDIIIDNLNKYKQFLINLKNNYISLENKIDESIN